MKKTSISKTSKDLSLLPRIDKPSFGGRFRTADKKVIKITKESLKRSSKMFEEVLEENIDLEDEKRSVLTQNLRIDFFPKTP